MGDRVRAIPLTKCQRDVMHEAERGDGAEISR